MSNRAVIEQYVRAVQQGDEQAFAELYALTKKGVFAFAYSIVGDRATAEDVLQETYIKVKLNICSYAPNTNFSAWLLQIAKNIAYNSIKKSKREMVCDNDTLSAKAHLDACSSAEYTDVLQVVNRVLAKEDKTILLMHAVGGYKHREIAKILDLPLGTVTWKYKNALKTVQKAIEEEQR